MFLFEMKSADQDIVVLTLSQINPTLQIFCEKLSMNYMKEDKLENSLTWIQVTVHASLHFTLYFDLWQM